MLSLSKRLALLLLLTLATYVCSIGAHKDHPQPACRRQDSSSRISWEFAGPTTYLKRFGRKGHTKLTSAAAVQNVVQGSNNSWFIGSVNGGVWRTNDITASRVRWENVLDGEPVTCSSISALHASAFNPNVIYAGCGGSTSSEQGPDWNVVNSGDWGGVMVSYNNGDSWQMLEKFPQNYYVTDILELQNGHIIVAAQSHLYNRNNGGIWISSSSTSSTDGGYSSFHKISDIPTFTLMLIPNTQHVLATHARTPQQSVSIIYNGSHVENVGQGLPWTKGAIPFYTCAAILKDGRVVVAGLTRLSVGAAALLPNSTDSQVFVSDSADLHSYTTWTELKQPMRLDQDSMPKDRMALLADPENNDLLYVAGNAGALVWRVDMQTREWTKMWNQPDVVDGSIPHGDCRNLAWDSGTNRLLLVSDGGIFARELPRQAGGKWVSLNGDYSALELLSAHYDPQDGRYVMGAQDNCALVTKPNATAKDVAIGFVEGDGAITIVDSKAKPSRLYGTTQFLGVGTIYSDPTTNKIGEGDDSGDDDDDGCGGLCFAQGDRFIEVQVYKYFPDPSSFPFFVHPYDLNFQDPTRLHVWINGTAERPSGFYEFHIPYTVNDKDDIAPPTLILETQTGDMMLDFVSGGYTKSKPDPNMLVGVSNSHLFVGAKGNPNISQVPLPVTFAMPVTLQYDESNGGARILGPLTHAKTVFMAIAPKDSNVIAVTGWQSIKDNRGDESIFLTTTSGIGGWQNITGNLREASGVSGKVRPGGLQFVNLDDTGNAHALLVGTSNGILVTFVSLNDSPVVGAANQHWTRLGTCDEFPIVLTADLDYEPISDRLVAATFGRGIYTLKNAKQRLLELRARTDPASIDVA